MDSVRMQLVRRDRRPDPAARAAVRPVAARSRLHQGLRAGRARERRPVHARRAVDGDGDRAARQRRRGGRAVPHAQPDQPHAHPGRRRALPGRALRGGGRRLHAPGAHRARRLDLVHRLGGLDVSARARVDPRSHASRRLLRDRAVHSRVVARLRRALAARAEPLRDRRGESRAHAAAASPRRCWTGSWSMPRRSRWSTTARCTGCGWSWANPWPEPAVDPALGRSVARLAEEELRGRLRSGQPSPHPAYADGSDSRLHVLP